MFDYDTRKKAAILLNAAVAIMEVVAVVMCARKYGLWMFQYYTVDSNLLALFASLSFLFFIIRNGSSGTSEFPFWVKIVKYVSVCGLTITFLVALIVLSNSYGPDGYKIMMVNGSFLFMHSLCPVLMFISFVFFEGGQPLEGKNVIYVLVPMMIYGIIIMALDILGVVDSPYYFLSVSDKPAYVSVFWLAAMMLSAYVVARLIEIMNSKMILFFSERDSISES